MLGLGFGSAIMSGLGFGLAIMLGLEFGLAIFDNKSNTASFFGLK